MCHGDEGAPAATLIGFAALLCDRDAAAATEKGTSYVLREHNAIADGYVLCADEIGSFLARHSGEGAIEMGVAAVDDDLLARGVPGL